MNSKIKALAEKMQAALETRKRDDGTDYICLADNSPEWMTEVCHKAHGDMLPDDRRYEMIQDALEAIAEYGDDSEHDYHEQIDGRVTIWNHERAAWLASHLDRGAYVDQAVGEYGGWPDEGIYAALGQGEYLERREVLDLVLAFLTERAGQ